MKGESGAHRVTMRVDRRDPFTPLQPFLVEAVLKSPFDGTCVRSTPRLFGSTAKRSPPRVFAANRHSSLFEDRLKQVKTQLALKFEIEPDTLSGSVQQITWPPSIVILPTALPTKEPSPTSSKAHPSSSPILVPPLVPHRLTYTFSYFSCPCHTHA
jgi:hypothetical protein